MKELNFVCKILPITCTQIETASFDIHKLTNPNVTNSTYSEGRMKNYYNTKAYVLFRDGYKCQQCKATNTRLETHHIVFRSNLGTDSPDNLVTLCAECHTTLHKHTENPQKEFLKLQKKCKVNTTDATQVSTISAYLKKELDFEEHFGYETKYNRERLGLPKAHFIDAMCIGLRDNENVEMPTHVYKKVSVSKGDYQQTECQPNKKGNRPKLSRRKIEGFKKFDRVNYLGVISFIKGRMSSGYAVLMDIDGNTVKPPLD